MTTPSKTAAGSSTDSTKLVSLLALAAGAVALPQTGHADIIFTDLSSSPVTVGYAGVDSFLFNLPGVAQVGFQRVSHTAPTYDLGVNTITYRTVLAGDRGDGMHGGIRGAANGFAAPQALGATWNNGGVNTFIDVAAGMATNAGHNPASNYDHQYLAWVFNDSSNGEAARYGWAEVSLSIGNVTLASGSGPNVTIWGYAYDNTGAKPTMGAVPEPTSGALLAMGAMALGARGLRQWRQKRAAVTQA